MPTHAAIPAELHCGQRRYVERAWFRFVASGTRLVARAALALAMAARPSEGAAATPSYSEHQDLSYYLTEDGEKAPIDSPADWQLRRRHIIEHVESVMGRFPRPGTPIPLEMEVLEEKEFDLFIRRKIAYHTDSSAARVTAWLFIPTAIAEARRPAMLCLHQTVQIGKDEAAGLGGNPHLDFAAEMAERGYVALAPDYPSFGEYPYEFDRDDYVSGSMKAVYDNSRAVDLLQSLPEVHADRIGCIGHSLGGHNAIFTALFEPRLKAIVSCCGFTQFPNYYDGDLRGWTTPRYMPRIASKYGSDPKRVPFDFTELVAALAPRPFLAVAPLEDSNFDNAGVRVVMEAAEPIYRLHNQSKHLVADYPLGGHDFPDDSRRRAYQFLDQCFEHQPSD
ncbi:MAG: alpha/beta fold hydrolase [Pirellulales bacterium]|nr:alpha/beta fold hydrolase [Pirellulales bacterium]